MSNMPKARRTRAVAIALAAEEQKLKRLAFLTLAIGATAALLSLPVLLG